MNVSDAVAARKSVQSFLDTPVPDEQIEELLTKAARAPSGGNVQPWRIYVIGCGTMPRFLEFMASRSGQETPAYAIYPEGLTEPYRSSRFKVGEDMYALLGIPREDKPARIRRLMENFRFFGAPAGLFCFVDRQMGPPQWSDLGMFLQTFMLLLQEEGLDSCAQECWSMYPQTVQEFCAMPENLMLFCGMAIGYRDETAPVNALRSDREPLETWVKVV
ncbi:MAG: nitroreductase [Nitratireductor sp.]|nr:nitroreductase [Nitratireductor sp.]